MTATLTLVVAVAANRVIGSKGDLPWRLPDDLKRFKRLTLGKPCIMGRKTWDSLPVKPLPGRTNIVVTRDAGFHAPGAITAKSFESAIRLAKAEHPPEIMVIGGEAIFAAALPLATRIELTEVGAEPEGDAFMPEFDPAEWRRATHQGPLEHNGLRYSFVTLERVRS